MTPKVGDTVYIKRGEYSQFAKWHVAGESSRSWFMFSEKPFGWQVANMAKHATKFPKSGKGYVFGTQRDMELSVWANQNRYRIGQIVESTQNASMLLTIAHMVDYKILPEGEPK